MGNKVKEARILHVELPLKKGFKHALSTRYQSDSIFLKLILDDGTVGYGESLPREYVTKETPQSVKESLKEILQNRVLGYAPAGYRELSSFIKGLSIWGGAAQCALELALFDAFGRYFKMPVSSIMGDKVNSALFYSGVVDAGGIPDVIKISLAFRLYGLRFIKVKVGVGDDNRRLKAVRSVLGRDADIRVDANCAWSADEAIERIKEMREYNISAVEQPVKADDYDGLKRVTDSVSETVIADESMCTVEDAAKLAGLKACNMFNIRISKCGGVLNSLKIADIARRSNIGIQLGCQVGESGVLSAAGWHFASRSKDISFCEGSYGRHLLKEDVTREDMTIRRGGTVRAVDGPGLGVNVLDGVLNKYTVSEDILY